uniref:Uncharacterized protein n=1 Tax=Daucus carota subsp. sativus TaxID=79200 RepID=A0A164THV8_DAUCS
MEDVDLLYNIPHPNSPTLFLEKSISEIGDHPSQDLLGHQSISSLTTSEVVELPNPSLFTDSLVVTVDASTANASIANSFTSSIGISHQSVSAVLSTNVLNNNQPLMNDNVASMAIPQPLIEEVPLADATQLDHLSITRAASEELIIVTALLGLRESELEERLSCRQAKGEDVSKRLRTSSSQAKGEIVDTTLDGEGEGVVSQGETLMQEYRDNERNAGTEETRMETAVDPLDASKFIHPVSAYQIMAGQSNVQAEETLGLLHTSEALERAQIAHAAVPKGMLSTQGDSKYDDSLADEDDDEDEEVAGPSEMPDWVFSQIQFW